jgi:hypothetical protein
MERHRLASKKNSYAKYVNEVIRPQIKVRSQERVENVDIGQVRRKVQEVPQEQYRPPVRLPVIK